MRAMLDKLKFIETITKMINDSDYEESVFFVYSDGVNWGVEIYAGEGSTLEESKVASMWWNIAMKNVYSLPPKTPSDLTFSFTFYNPRADSDESPVDKIEEMDQLFKIQLEKTSIYTSLKSD